MFCLCPDGYSLASDWKTCKDNDECLEEDNGGCDQMCVNTPGGHQCECHVGFRKIKVEGSCQDVNECQDIPALCGHGDCVNLPGTYLCECHSGFRLDDGTCEDIDECKNQAQCSKIGKKCNFKSAKKTLFAISKMVVLNFFVVQKIDFWPFLK